MRKITQRTPRTPVIGVTSGGARVAPRASGLPQIADEFLQRGSRQLRAKNGSRFPFVISAEFALVAMVPTLKEWG